MTSVALATALARREMFFALFPRATPAIYGAQLACAGVLLIAIVGLWMWRRWAFVLAVGMTPVVVVLDMIAGGPLRHMVAGSISGLLIWLLGRPLWARFR